MRAGPNADTPRFSVYLTHHVVEGEESRRGRNRGTRGIAYRLGDFKTESRGGCKTILTELESCVYRGACLWLWP
eukprot:COSAG02_NODE_3227_length_7144_cov_17.684247_2_plen_74_part_00